MGLGLGCLTPLSTNFSYIVAVSFIDGGNRRTRRKHRLVASHSSTPRHEWDSNSQR